MNIIVDAFGGDNAPVEIIKGAEQARKELAIDITLVGKEDIIRKVNEFFLVFGAEPYNAHGPLDFSGTYIFKALEEKVARYDYEYANKLIEERKFEQLEMYTMNLIMGLV